MTTVDEAFPSPAQPGLDTAGSSRPRLLLRLVVGFAFGLLIGIGVAAAALVAWDAGYQGRVLPGVHVGGVDLSGLDREQATATLARAFSSYGDGRVVLHVDTGDIVIPDAVFGRRPDTDAMVERAMRAGRDGTPAERAVGEIRQAIDGVDLSPAVTLDAEALQREVVGGLAKRESPPVNAQVVRGPSGFYTVPAVAGRHYDASAAAATALSDVSRIDAPDEVVVDVSGSDLPATYTDAQAQAVKAAADRMRGKVTVTFKKQQWTIKGSVVRSWIGLRNGADGSAEPSVDRAAIAAALKKVASGVRKDPVSAAYLGGRSGRIVGVAPARNGRKLDVDATVAAIAQAMMDRAGGTAAEPVAVKTAKVAPRRTTAEATRKAPLMQRLGSWKTWFPISDHNYYGANIWLPAKIIDGTVLRPGQTFEWWRAVGPVTTSRGFGPGGYIAGDHTDPTGALGGGMCSSSTTLFNAALRAGLRMGSRVNHQYYISRYPLGLDATVSKSSTGTRTMTFTNDTGHPIVIRTYRYTKGGVGWVRYEIWGIPDGRTVSIGSPVVSNVRKATTRTVYVSTLPHGARQQTEYPADGMDVSVTRVVRDSHGRVIHRETYYSHYQLWNGIIQVGA